MSHHNFSQDHLGLKLGLEIAKLLLRGAAVTAAFLTIKEIHKVHKAIEAKKA